MKIELDGVVLYLGRLRKDGSRNVERVRLKDFRPLLPKLRRARLPGRMKGKRLLVRLDDDHQLSLLD